MSRDQSVDGDRPRDGEGATGTIHRAIDPNPDEPYMEILGAIAEVEGCEIEALPPLYDRIDHLVENLFQTPPPPQAQVQMEFSYAGYRIRLDQTGSLTIMPHSDSADTGATDAR